MLRCECKSHNCRQLSSGQANCCGVEGHRRTHSCSHLDVDKLKKKKKSPKESAVEHKPAESPSTQHFLRSVAAGVPRRGPATFPASQVSAQLAFSAILCGSTNKENGSNLKNSLVTRLGHNGLTVSSKLAWWKDTVGPVCCSH